MNIDNLHDALGLLDDEIIEEVEALRSGRKQGGKNGGVTKLIRWGRIAACLGVFLVGAVTISFLWNSGFGNAKKSSVRGDAATDEEIVGESDDVSDDVNDLYVNENTSTGTGESEKQNHEVKVEITSIQENSIIGIIKESSDKALYSVGAEVKIVSPDKTELTERSVVVVRFTKQTSTELVGGHDAGLSEKVIYAESIMLDDME